MARDKYVDMGTRRKEKPIRASEDSYRYTEDYINDVLMCSPWGEDYQSYIPGCQDIGFGSYVMVKKILPVAPECTPKVWHIYWAVPNSDSKNNDGYDKYGKYGVEIMIPAIRFVGMSNYQVTKIERVVLFPREYIVIDEAHLQKYIGFGYAPVNTYYANKVDTLSLDLITKSRDLCEEEREIIWAMQLDGLTESQACQEYFLCKHDTGAPSTLMYAPTRELLEEIIQTFGNGE